MNVDKLNDTINEFEKEVKNIINYSDKLNELNELTEQINIAKEKIDINNEFTRNLSKTLSSEMDDLKSRTTAVHNYITEEMKGLKNTQLDMISQNKHMIEDQNKKLIESISRTDDKIEVLNRGLVNKIDEIKFEMEIQFKNIKLRKNISDIVGVLISIVLLYFLLK